MAQGGLYVQKKRGKKAETLACRKRREMAGAVMGEIVVFWYANVSLRKRREGSETDVRVAV